MRSLFLTSLVGWLFLSISTPIHGNEPVDRIVFRGKTIAEWRGLLQHPEAKPRSRAATALGLGPFGRKAVPLLVHALQDSDEDVRKSAVIALGNLGPDAADAVPALCAGLAGGECNTDIVRALIRIGPAAVPVLLSEENRGNKNWAQPRDISAIGPAALPPLIAALSNKDSHIRTNAADVLGYLGPDAAPAVPALVHALGDREFAVRREAVEALRCIGPRAAAALPALTQLLAKEDNELQGPLWAAVERIDFSATLPFLLKRFRGERPPADVVGALSRSAPAGQDVLRDFFRKGDADSRVYLLANLSTAEPAVLPLLLEGLEDRSCEVRQAAAKGLRRSEADLAPVLPRLIKALEVENADIGVDIARAIGRICPPPRLALVTLAGALRHPHEAVAIAAGEELEYLGQLARSVLPLILEGFRDFRPGVRRYVVTVLGKIRAEEREIVQTLCAALKDESIRVRWEAAEVLGALGPQSRSVLAGLTPHMAWSGPRALDTSRGDVHVDVVAGALRAGLRDSNSWVRISAAEALRLRGFTDADVVYTLAWEVLEFPDWFRKESDLPHRRSALRTLHNMGPAAARAFPALTLALWDSDENNRALSRAALGRINPQLRQEPHSTTALDWRPLASALSDESAEKRLDACHELGQMGAPARPAIPALCELLLERDSQMRCRAIISLQQIAPDDRIALPALIESLTDPSSEVRLKAAQALGTMGAAACPALDALRSVSRDQDVNVRIAAIVAMACIEKGNETAVRELLAMAEHGKEPICTEAAQALWKLKRRGELVPVLARMVHREEGRTRYYGTEVLRQLREEHTQEVTAFVKPLLRHPERGVRESAHRILWNLPRRRDHLQFGFPV